MSYNLTTPLPLTLPLSSYPIYALHRPSILSTLPDRYLSVFAPFAIYWSFSLFFHFLDSLHLPALQRYKLHEPEEVVSKNRVTVKEVIKAVLVQQVLQTVLGLLWLEEDDPLKGPFRNHKRELQTYGYWVGRVVMGVLGKKMGGQLWKAQGAELTSWVYWWGVPIAQYLFAAFVLDAWQYFWHRYFHTNRFLYRHIHSIHHRLYVPYAFGALYNHPLEGFVLDTLGAALAQSCALMTTRQAITVDDHCGYKFPWDPFQVLFANDCDYHDIHHQIAGLKYNFSQPYFLHFDWLLGTRLTRAQFEAKKNKRFASSTSSTTPSSSTSSSTPSTPPPEKAPTNEVNGPNELAPTPTSRRRGVAMKEE
ncbi:hypothetical protein BCR35DRAFT_305868 [Leucosporidium creatinivorum]|uniref:Fatty acid hydroxylase domain-containing protein n=1 Tax=Leucosporidium creatinivorum TaxID=106004 RepID=A0A1Y2EXB8_9BASI|nr:hypothetical protein BCR35DRAFT_305868 [Leucosporidium creatinivorum]